MDPIAVQEVSESPEDIPDNTESEKERLFKSRALAEGRQTHLERAMMASSCDLAPRGHGNYKSAICSDCPADA